VYFAKILKGLDKKVYFVVFSAKKANGGFFCFVAISRRKRRAGMKKVVKAVVVLLAVMLWGLSPVRAGDRVELKPDSVELVAPGRSEIPPAPYVGFYTFHGDEGAGLVFGISVQSVFRPHHIEIFLDGKLARVRQTKTFDRRSLSGGGGVEYAPVQQGYGEDVFVFSETGEYEISVRVYLDKNAYWLAQYVLVVKPFDFYMTMCQTEDEVVLSYWLYSLLPGDLPEEIYVDIGGLMGGFVPVDPGLNVAVLAVDRDEYAASVGSGRSLETALTDTDTGESVARDVWYPYFGQLVYCTEGKG
jgi:hypothetical protein